jgi:hypothetical protein
VSKGEAYLGYYYVGKSPHVPKILTMAQNEGEKNTIVPIHMCLKWNVPI